MPEGFASWSMRAFFRVSPCARSQIPAGNGARREYNEFVKPAVVSTNLDPPGRGTNG
jgi:hypothetical protein